MIRTMLYFLIFAATVTTTGCASSFLPKPVDAPAVFTLASPALPNAAPPSSLGIGAAPLGAASAGPTLIISAPQASNGLNSTHMLYVPRANEIGYFVQSQWVDSPSAMLMPLIAQAIQSTGVFKAVISNPTSAISQFRMDTELVKLEQSFLVKPSQVQFALRAVIINTTTRSVVARRDFSAVMPTPTEDAYGGVIAAQRAVQVVTAELATFCADAVRQ